MKLNIIVIFALLGGLLSFSLWPVLSGIEISSACKDNPIADCLTIEKTEPRIMYLMGGQEFDDSGISSRSEYCSITERCKSELVYVPLSLLMGALTGAIVGAMYTKLKKDH